LEVHQPRWKLAVVAAAVLRMQVYLLHWHESANVLKRWHPSPMSIDSSHRDHSNHRWLKCHVPHVQWPGAVGKETQSHHRHVNIIHNGWHSNQTRPDTHFCSVLRPRSPLSISYCFTSSLPLLHALNVQNHALIRGCDGNHSHPTLHHLVLFRSCTTV